MADKKLLVLVDGSSYLYRAFHALPQLTNSAGEPTGAIYGVLNMLKRLMSDYETQHFAVIFDPKGDTFRNDLYPEYKANRSKMPQELAAQIAPLHNIIKAMGIPLVVVDHVEADDVIGTFAQLASQHDYETVISTGDKDLAQLVTGDVTLVNTMTETIMDEAGVVEKFGVEPNRIIDYLTLIGDSSDNIPGVSKVGPKTALKWLEAYGSLDEIIAHADEIKGKVGENLRECLGHLPLSRELVTIKCNVNLPCPLEELKLSNPDQASLAEWYRRFEFKGFLSNALSNQAVKKTEYETILTEMEFKQWIDRLKRAELFAFDTETTSLEYMNAKLVGVSFAVELGEAAYLPFGHDPNVVSNQLDQAIVLAELKPILENPSKMKVGQNLKYDKHVLANHGIHLEGIAFDTMLESYVLNSSGSRHDLDSLALKYLGKQNISYEEVAGKGAKQLTFDQVPLDRAAPYAAEDADVAMALHQQLWPKLKEAGRSQGIFEKIEIPLLSILEKMEHYGVLVDRNELKRQSEDLAKEIDRIEKEAYDLVGVSFNMASPKQLQEIFYEKMKLPVLQKTPKGKPSTAEAVLQELALDYPLPKLILSYRQLSKLKSTYTDRLPEQINGRTGRVHTSYHQAVTATGRLSSSDPNLQNIPIRYSEGERVRKAFIAPDGYQLVAADYSQVELRIMAHLSNDKSLLKAFSNGWDVHRSTASEVFGVHFDEVSKDQRRSAKAINFGLMYGMSAYGLSKQLGVDPKSAQTYIDLYFDRYPGVKKYMDQTRKLAHEQGYVETFLGRRLYLSDINAGNLQRQKAAERAAINAPLQGTAADIIKLAMIAADQWLRSNSQVDAKMIMQVHDELVFEAAEKDVQTVSQAVEHAMISAIELNVPLQVAVGVGKNWQQAH